MWAPISGDRTRTVPTGVCSSRTVACKESSSHALALERVSHLRFAAAGFSNLTRDHLDFHQDMEAYYQAKRRLFFEDLRPGATSVVNVEDPAGARLLGELRQAGRSAWSVGSSRGHDVASVRRELSLHATVLELQTPVGTVRVRSPLIGAHNADNLALAAGIALAAGLDKGSGVAGPLHAGSGPGAAGKGRQPARHRSSAGLRRLSAHTDDALIRVMACFVRWEPSA